MVVQNYNVQTSSQHTSTSLQTASATSLKNIESWQMSTQKAQSSNLNGTEQTTKSNLAEPSGGSGSSRLLQTYQQVLGSSLNLLSAQRNRMPQQIAQQGINRMEDLPKTPGELRRRLSALLFELLLGRKKSIPPSEYADTGNAAVQGNYSGSYSFETSFFSSLFSVSGISGAGAAGQTLYESEQVSYRAQGVVHTADGKTINVDISMQMSREFVSYMNINADAVNNLYDPLVINYGGTAASLMKETFEFDLTLDGSLEKLAMLGDGSGFLALDKNGDGIINDGSELFGPSSGCGFTELRAYDGDGNGWIDEADDIFDKLVVWHRNKDGTDIAYTLKELGIGAIFLGDIATEFSFKGENNETLGIMRSTSFFLKEDGGSGTLSHIDLAF